MGWLLLVPRVGALRPQARVAGPSSRQPEMGWPLAPPQPPAHGAGGTPTPSPSVRLVLRLAFSLKRHILWNEPTLRLY